METNTKEFAVAELTKQLQAVHPRIILNNNWYATTKNLFDRYLPPGNAYHKALSDWQESGHYADPGDSDQLRRYEAKVKELLGLVISQIETHGIYTPPVPPAPIIKKSGLNGLSIQDWLGVLGVVVVVCGGVYALGEKIGELKSAVREKELTSSLDSARYDVKRMKGKTDSLLKGLYPIEVYEDLHKLAVERKARPK